MLKITKSKVYIYEVTCNTGFTISGSSTMTCGADGTFDQTPTCEGNPQNNFPTKYV